MERKQFSLQTTGLSVGYGKNTVVSEVNFELRAGEIITLIGPNGAGKSTLLKSITGQLAPLDGTVLLEGQNMQSLSRNEIAKTVSILMTGQLRTELMTCRDVVETGRYPYTGRLGILSQKDTEIVNTSMELVGVSSLADTDFSRISDGQRQLVLLSRAICQEPEVLILDEPTSYLDISHKLELMDVLKRLSRQRHIAVIQSLHELDLAQKCSDRLLCIKDGKVDRYGTVREIFAGDYIRTLYNVKSGSFSNYYSSLEFAAPKGEVEVFVIGGMGSGIEIYRLLQQRGIPFTAGILWENDIDYPAASALATELVSIPFGQPIDETCISRAKALIDSTVYTLCAIEDEAMIGSAAPLKALKDYASACGKLKTEAAEYGV